MMCQNLLRGSLCRAFSSQRVTTSRLLSQRSLHDVTRSAFGDGQRTRMRPFSSKTEYYYDSQSGKHVPVHDETHVNVLVATMVDQDVVISEEQLQAWASQGVSGVKLNPSSFDFTSLTKDLSFPEHFKLWIPHGALGDSEPVHTDHAVYEVEYDPENKEQTQSTVADLASANRWSAIVCDEAAVSDAMLTASGVATILDETKGGDYVYLAGPESDAIVELAEELSYLDVEGPTLKARMVIDLTRIESEPEEGLEECLMMGINKFVIDPDRLQWVAELVQEQGKTCDIESGS